jgi:DNA-binding transcriptional LysR family regulator
MDWEDRIGRRLKLRDVNILLTVVQSGSMAKAAQVLAVSNPAVSKAISDLEHTLGVRLLERSPQGVDPTVYGRALLDRGVAAFDELKQAVKHIEFLMDPTAGEMRIGASIAMSAGFIAAVTDRLSRSHPKITFQVLSADTATTYRALQDRKVDLVIVHILSPFADDHMNTEILFHEPQVVLAGASNPLARRRKVELANLIDVPWTLPPPESLFGGLVLEAFRSKGLDLPRTVVTASLPMRFAMLAAGRFVTMAPASIARLPRKNIALKMLNIDLPTSIRPAAVITLKKRPLSPVAELFVKCAREVAKSLAEKKW